MGWAEWLDLIAKGAGTYFGYKDAKNQEKWQMSPRDLFALQNPNSSSPMWDVQSDWNGGNPNIQKTMTPQLQQAFDEHIWKAMAQPPSNYGQNENMDRLKNASENYQLSRYGLEGTPYSKKPEPTGDLRYEPIISSITGGEDEGVEERSLGDTYTDAGLEDNAERSLDEIQRAIQSRDAINNPNRGNSNSNVPYDDDWNNGGAETWIKRAIAALIGSQVPMGGKLAMNLMEDYNWNGNQYGMMSPDSADFLTSFQNPDGTLADEFMGDWDRFPDARNRGQEAYNRGVGDRAGAYVGGGFLPNQYGDVYEGRSGYGTNPVTGGNDENYGDYRTDPSLSMMGGRQQVIEPTGRQGFGYGKYTPNGSATGGGAYNYATRLPPRGAAGRG